MWSLRWGSLASRAVLLAACGLAACGNDTGLVLTLDAPNGPGAASRIEIVLASAADEAIETVSGQRIAPGKLETAAVRYYRQEAPAGAVGKVARVDGFVIRIEARDGVSGAEPFVPFALAFDEAGALIGAGAVLGADGLPAAIEVPAAARIEASAAMIPLGPADLTREIASGGSAVIGCDGAAGPARSGFAWRPPSGGELRLLLPPAGQDSAAERALDLDCDGHAADADDCDDLRPKYHAGATDTCDGEDTNCQGDRVAVEACPLQPGACAGNPEGVRLCSDGGAPMTSPCMAPPACRCQLGACSRCVLAFEGAPPAKTCSPGLGKLKLSSCGTLGLCTVEIVAHNARWDVGIGAAIVGPFGRRVELLGAEIFVRAKYAAPALPLVAGSSVGDIHLAVTSGNVTEYVGVDLELAMSAVGACAEQAEVGSTFKMVCSP